MREGPPIRGANMAEEILLDVRHLAKRFGDTTVLNDVSFRVERGEVVVIIGPSGCGKSTLLRCLNRLEKPSEGTILFHGRGLTDEPKALISLRTKVGMVFQRFHLFPHLRVLDNLTLAPRLVLGEAAEQAEARAREWLVRVGLEDKADAYPKQLSGGQEQRVAIARCMMMNPELILFDEPTSALDPELVGEVLEVMRTLAGEGRTMCVVTHEMAFARDVAHRILMMDQGRIIEEGSAREILESPSHPRTRTFLRRILDRSGR